MKKSITTILFDLDGTLLPMDIEEFTEVYLKLLAKKSFELGFDPKAAIAAVWNGTKAMIKNDGSMSNHDRFWNSFASDMGEKSRKLESEFDKFYANEFDTVKSVTQLNPLAKEVVLKLKERGYTVILATNPLFPMVAVETRLSWLGLTTKDFTLCTSYENYSFCKPNVNYYTEILEKCGKIAEETLMVGNDVDEDLCAAEIGMDTYLITDCLINKSNKDISEIEQGSFEDFMKFI